MVIWYFMSHLIKVKHFSPHQINLCRSIWVYEFIVLSVLSNYIAIRIHHTHLRGVCVYSSTHLVSGARFFNPQVGTYLRNTTPMWQLWASFLVPWRPGHRTWSTRSSQTIFRRSMYEGFFFYTYGFVWTMDCMAQLGLK